MSIKNNETRGLSGEFSTEYSTERKKNIQDILGLNEVEVKLLLKQENSLIFEYSKKIVKKCSGTNCNKTVVPYSYRYCRYHHDLRIIDQSKSDLG